jgi:hypothetical protein
MEMYTSIQDRLKKQAMGRLHVALQTPVAGSAAVNPPEMLRLVS